MGEIPTSSLTSRIAACSIASPRLNFAARPVPKAASGTAFLHTEQNGPIIDYEADCGGTQKFLEVDFAIGEIYDSAAQSGPRKRMLGRIGVTRTEWRTRSPGRGDSIRTVGGKD